jgi:hypothetical protein
VTKPTKLERAVLEKLLSGDDPLLSRLRSQAERATVSSREMTGAGFVVSFEIPADAPILDGKPSFHFGDVSATIDGLAQGAGFVLFVKKGRIDALEGYTYDEDWPEHIERFKLEFEREPRPMIPM